MSEIQLLNGESYGEAARRLQRALTESRAEVARLRSYNEGQDRAVRDLMARVERLQTVLSGVVKAWDSLRPGDYSRDIVETWLIDKMKPAIEVARRDVEENVP